MNILAIETSTDACSAALLCNETLIARYQFAPRQHTALILPMIDSLFTEAGISKNTLNAVAFGRGPGSFTGIRIATAIAQGIGFALDVPLIPVSTLHALAALAYNKYQSKSILTALDARMNQVYWCAYVWNENGYMQARMEETVVSPEDIELPEAIEEWVGIGDGWKYYYDRLLSKMSKPLQQYFSDEYPRANEIATIAKQLYIEGKVISAADALPVYLREKVV